MRKGEEGGEAPLSTTDRGTNEAPSVALKMKEAGSEVDSLEGVSAPKAGKKKKNSHAETFAPHVCVFGRSQLPSVCNS